jgi:hypothetical protein
MKLGAFLCIKKYHSVTLTKWFHYIVQGGLYLVRIYGHFWKVRTKELVKKYY